VLGGLLLCEPIRFLASRWACSAFAVCPELRLGVRQLLLLLGHLLLALGSTFACSSAAFFWASVARCRDCCA